MGRVGIEPTTLGLKGPCSAAELPARWNVVRALLWINGGGARGSSPGARFRVASFALVAPGNPRFRPSPRAVGPRRTCATRRPRASIPDMNVKIAPVSDPSRGRLHG